MPLKLEYSTQAEIPTGLENHYTPRDGKFVLAIEGDVVPKAQLEQFRNTNISILKERDELREKVKGFEGLNPEDVRKAISERDTLKGQLEKGGGSDIDKVIAARLNPVLEQLTGLKSQLETKEKELRVKTVNEAVISEATRKGLKPGAHEDLLLRAGRAVTVDGGAIRVVGADGKVRYRAADGTTPMDLGDWVGELFSSAPHLFESNSGGGAAGNGSGGAGTAGDVNPWKKETFNLTKQGQLVTANPERARQLCIAAGKTPTW
jgi:hypothetical protein